MLFVTVAAFDNYISAHIAKGRLEEEHIKCYLQDENINTIYPLLSGALGGIKLMVAEVQAERALEILNETAD